MCIPLPIINFSREHESRHYQIHICYLYFRLQWSISLFLRSIVISFCCKNLQFNKLTSSFFFSLLSRIPLSSFLVLSSTDSTRGVPITWKLLGWVKKREGRVPLHCLQVARKFKTCWRKVKASELFSSGSHLAYALNGAFAEWMADGYAYHLDNNIPSCPLLF